MEKTSHDNKNIKNSLKLAERLQTYLFTWSNSEKNEDTMHLIEIAIDTTNKIIENLNITTKS
ncbi:hypothetical protein ID858_17290 [Xenorhabdus sp. DI]|uniref:hypothetical protein n=1 Tax=Xenorhabdus doucetiae TaxID=351671 RepID=UPI0019A5D3F9|nr:MULTISPECIES: hypothetical protein [unclassified Xenorhabdus]MBD2786438.1 hypothetical protein [Xenorhabdus sp. 3]MBD2790248.1 hypothetical protein [Xenorhabdus sp. DI]